MSPSEATSPDVCGEAAGSVDGRRGIGRRVVNTSETTRLDEYDTNI